MNSAPTRPLHVLLVEDHEDSAAALAMLLGRDGHHVITAHAFADAVAAAAGMPRIDLLVADIGLPDGNGCELLRILKGRVGGGPAHAVAVTGHGEEHWQEECRRAGYERFLLKPVRFEDVLAALASLQAAPDASPVGAAAPVPGGAS